MESRCAMISNPQIFGGDSEEHKTEPKSIYNESSYTREIVLKMSEKLTQ
jgi:hypothetical protein